MSFGLQLTTPVTTEPVSLADMKAYLSVDPDFTLDDDLISALISSARQSAEDFLGRSLAPQSWLLTLDRFPSFRVMDAAPSRSDYDAFGNYSFSGYRSLLESQAIALPRPPLSQVQSVKYVDLNSGILTTMDPSAYQVDAVGEPGRIFPAVNTVWPETSPVPGAVQIAFSSGSAAATPSTLLAIKMRAASYYANREEPTAAVPSNGLFEALLAGQGRVNLFGYTGR